MKDYIILTDSSTDLPLSYVSENNIPFVSLTYIIDDNEFKDDLGEKISVEQFYENMKTGTLPTTAQVNMLEYTEIFKAFLDRGQDLIYLGFSSGLSGSVGNAAAAAKELAEEYPQRKIAVVDTLCASLGEGLLVYTAVEMSKNGASFEEVVQFAENSKLKLNHWFTVDDLNHLLRGGRVSKLSAIFGTILNIKPVLNVNEEGKLIPRDKIRGRENSIKALADKYGKYADMSMEQTVFISHGNCKADAEKLKELLEKTYKNIKGFIINPTDRKSVV